MAIALFFTAFVVIICIICYYGCYLTLFFFFINNSLCGCENSLQLKNLYSESCLAIDFYLCLASCCTVTFNEKIATLNLLNHL